MFDSCQPRISEMPIEEILKIWIKALRDQQIDQIDPL